MKRASGWLVTAAVAAVLLAGCGSNAVPAPSPAMGPQVNLPVPTRVLRTPVVTFAGRRTNLAAFHGKVLVISVMMTLCQEECPLDTANVVAAARAVEHAGLGGKVEFVSLTIDPQRDTPARLRAYRHLFAPAPADWQLVTGSRAALSRLWREFGIYAHKVPEPSPPAHDWLTGKPLTYDMTHSDQVFFLDGRGHLRFFLEGVPHVAPGAPMPAQLRRFLSATGQKNLRRPPVGAWGVSQELEVLSWLTDHRLPGAGQD